MFFVFKKKSDSFKWSNSLKCQLLIIGHYFVELWGDKSTYLFPFWLSVSLILPTTSCIVYRALHCCSVTHSIVNRTLHSLAMQSNAIIWEFCAVTFAYAKQNKQTNKQKIKHTQKTWPIWMAHTHIWIWKYPLLNNRLLMTFSEVSTLSVSGGIKHTFSANIWFWYLHTTLFCPYKKVRKLDQ